MDQSVFAFLKSYSFDPKEINRLMVTAFLNSKQIKVPKSNFLNSFIIHQGDNEYESLQDFLEVFNFTYLEELIKVFEFVISPKEKIVTGAVYTPENIRNYIVSQCLTEDIDYNSAKICDPACGCSGFLYTAAKFLKNNTNLTYKEIYENNLYGIDIQEYSITRSKILLTLLAVEDGEKEIDFDFNLVKGNSLNFDWCEKITNFEGFDIIIGNPPYVCSRNIDEESRELLTNWEVCSTGKPDLYIPFFQIGVENLKPSGKLGFITMNTFFKSINGRALRKYFKENSIDLQILDFAGNQIFKSKSTYTCICIIKKEESSAIKYFQGNKESIYDDIKFKNIDYAQLNSREGWNLSHSEIINKLENTGIPFIDLFTTKSGIATLKNHIYIFDPIRKDDTYYYLQNGDTFPIEKGICREIINPNKLSSVDKISSLKKVVIFPYEHNQKGDAELIDEEKFQDLYPKTYTYLLEKKPLLATRDKGKGSYPNWYAYGRKQSLERFKNKLFFPHIASTIPNYAISSDENLLFHNGKAVVSKDKSELQFLAKIMSSEIFWFYIKHSSKPYSSGYFSLSKNYIKNFGICNCSNEEKAFVINADEEELNNFLSEKYKIKLPI